MTTLIPDASIILKWSLEREDEPDFQKALMILEDYLAEKVDIFLPALWRYEVGNILGRKKPEMASEIFRISLRYQFNEEPLDEAYSLQVLALMREVKGISFYDASYHILAIRKHGFYVTADRDYYRRALQHGSIMLLSEIGGKHGLF
jgi:predicted nucleic acid-binding protein